MSKTKEVTFIESSSSNENNTDQRNNITSNNKLNYQNDIKHVTNNILMENDFSYIDDDVDDDDDDSINKTSNIIKNNNIKIIENSFASTLNTTKFNNNNDNLILDKKNIIKKFPEKLKSRDNEISISSSSSSCSGSSKKHENLDKIINYNIKIVKKDILTKNCSNKLENIIDDNNIKNNNKSLHKISDKTAYEKCESNKTHQSNITDQNSKIKLATTDICDDTSGDNEEDPYVELQEYLEKVKREINDVFEEYKTKNREIENPNTNISKCQISSINSMNSDLLLKEQLNSLQTTSTNEIQMNKEKFQIHLDDNNEKFNNKTNESKDVNIWANKIIQELDNLVASNEAASNKLKKYHDHKTIVKLEKHATIPLQSFNLNDNSTLTKSKTRYNNNDNSSLKLNVIKNDKNDEQQLQQHSLLNPLKKDETVLKIEEDFSNNHKIIPLSNLSPTTQIKLKRDKQNYLQSSTSSPGSGEFSKKSSTSTIWTSEESILRNAVQFDEDTKSTSSFDEASGILSSGKSRNSLDSSELDNEQTESGIGTATPPKDTDLNLRKTQKFKLIKCNSVQSSSDDPDLLEVLSLYEGIVNDDEHDYDSIIKNHNYNTDDIDSNYDDIQEVVLRKKTTEPKINDHHRYAISMPFNRALKTRSHIIEPSKFCHTSSSASQKEFKYTTGSKESIGIGNSFGQDNFVNDSISSSNIQELPSQSSASLFSGNDHNIGMEIVELTTKSNSAPLLMKKVKKRDEFNYGHKENTLRYSRSQSDRYLAEIEAIEACKWLKAAGFPQYAQMYEDLQFPIDLSNVAKDHPVLENDPLQSLYRRLCILNRCAALRLDNAHHKSHQGPQKDDSDDEGFALSDNWTFQPQSRRWSRIGEMGLELPTKNKDKVDSSSKESSPERYDDDDDDDDDHTRNLDLCKTDSESMTRLRRTGSERLKDGAKAFLRRVESIKSRRRKRQNRDGFVMSGGGGTGHNHHNRQQVLDLKIVQPSSDTTNIKDKAGINIVFSTPPSPSAVSPIHFYPRNVIGNELKIPAENSTIFLHPNRLSPKHIPTTPRTCHSMRSSPLHFFTNPMPHLKECKSDESSSYFSDSQDSSAGDKLTNMKKITSRSRRFLQRSGKVDDIGAHSDSECHAGTGRKFIVKDQNSTDQEGKGKKLSRGGSLNLGKESKKYRDKFHNRSFRSGGGSTVKKGKDNTETKTNKIPVVRWHSFQTHEKPPLIFKKCFDENAELKQKEKGPLFAAMSCGQLQVLRKLALVTLTGYMEHYCPSHRTGWNWELPKFIKKIKTPDYKDKKVFGVPLLLILQRSGKCFPIGITAAMRWLQLNALEQTGLFRKSGVKSRIIKLKETIEILELYEDCMDMFDNQQAYDIADMLKQYFRELPDSLLTAKMSETFVAICQHLPPEKRLDAVQAAILLLPDENRDVLYTLLAFLNDVASKSHLNQMTASNLAVCLAPSLFNGNIATGNPVAVSPRRRNKSGSPSMKELSETKASHECLTLMIDQYKEIFTATSDRINKCNFGYMEESNPVTLEALGDGMPFHNWRGYLYECTSATMKEGREKTRGWIAINSLDPAIDIGYKKVNDGHLLRLWRCLTEIEGPPGDVLNFILNERSIWDGKLIKSQLIKQLDERTEIVQYVIDGQIPTDFCVLRSWQINLPKQACVIVETSIKHREAIPMQGSIRGVVLASRYLIEPCGSGRSRVMHLSRVDLKGKTPEWYNKNYGHICSQYLSKIRNAFRHVADGPESKV